MNFTVATNRKYKNKEENVVEESEFHRCVAF
ncbi:MAG: single-stranded DNA-binding protein [Patescibacteria group bacterium]